MMLQTLLWLGASFGAARAANCTRDTLQAGADSLVAAQTAGNPALLKPVASDLTYTENRKPATFASGILATALKPDHNRSALDRTQCATYTEVIVATAPKPYVLGYQTFWKDGAIKELHAIFTSKGDWLFNATGTLYWSSREDWGTIPADKRDSRAVIQAAADAYCDIFNNKSVTVPWGKPCARLEGGSYTGNGGPNDSCNVGIPSGVKIINRRYVIDETVGEVDVMNDFASELPDSHEFRVEGGKLRYVHTITVMTGAKGKGKKGSRGNSILQDIKDQLEMA